MQNSDNSGIIKITYYTDPLCCWSWGFEPQWRRLRFEFRNQISWKYVMGGLIPNWERYNDPMNSISKPLQMGPLWREVYYTTGMNVNDSIWFKDPPQSSFPSCIAVKGAGIQSPGLEEMMLRELREAVMVKGINISKRDELLKIAENIAAKNNEFDFQDFIKTLDDGNAAEAFKVDLQQAKLSGIGRFPTLTFETEEKGLILTGYRPYPVLIDALQQISPGIKPDAPIENKDEYHDFWYNITEREMKEVRIQ